jgi:uncharacterized protein YyaL (SSP411 family)
VRSFGSNYTRKQFVSAPAHLPLPLLRTMATAHRPHTNALAQTSSPYLLQHAHNPVQWVPWSSSALEDAKKQGKMVFLSIGYATCHWCHVMAHECFEDEEVAEVMNENFICVKVDRGKLVKDY